VTRLSAACLLVFAAFAAAPHAVADPADLVPYCSGDETPIDDNCRAPAYQYYTHDTPGANPELPDGVDPGTIPADADLQG
jgi:hypothetical protein